MKNILIEKINKADWWHVPPKDLKAYKARGKFFASTFSQAEFYGRPNNNSEKVNIKNPIFGFSELEILEQLFTKKEAVKYLHSVLESKNYYNDRINLDAKMHDKAKSMKFDSIVLMTKAGKKSLQKNRKPNSIELNLILTK